MNPEQQPDGAETSRIIQNVYAFGGFAYGTINADVHVHGDGRPVYTLAEHRPPSGDPNPRWRQQPSRLLDARSGVVPFTGREAELDDLAAWRDQDDKLAFRWLHGTGGRGKTRLASRFAELSAEAGWKTIEVHHGGQITPESQGSQDMRASKRKGLLVLVDYADRWPMLHLDWLFANQLFSQRTPVPVRVLLVARSAHSWPAVRSQLGRRAHTSTQALDALPKQESDRQRAFDAARARFAQIYELDDADQIRRPRSLNDPEFGLTLTLHISALVAVDAHLAQRDVPADTAGLSAYLLDREREFWARLHENGRDGLRFETDPKSMAKVVYTAALTGVIGHGDGIDAVKPLKISGAPERLLEDHGFCYPSVDSALVLEPLYPDRLAEDFIALLTPGHDIADHFPDPWTTSAPTSLLSDANRKWTPRSVTVLATTASRWPHLADRILYPLLRTAPDLALAGGNAALIALASGTTNPYHEQIDPNLLAVLEAIEPLLRGSRRIGINAGALAISERLTAFRLTTITDAAERSRLLHDLGLQRMDAGDRHGAVDAFTEVVALNRELAGHDLETRRGRLAGALNNLSLALSNIGRWQQALDASREGVALSREQYENDRVTHRESFASSLNNLAHVLTSMRRWDEAMEAGDEAIDLFSSGVEPRHRQYFLAKCMIGKSIRLAGASRKDEALAACERAVAMNRELTAYAPEIMRHDFAVTLIEFGIRLSDTGRRDEALAAFEEAAPLYFRDTPRSVAEMLQNVGADVSGSQRHEDSAILSEWAALLDLESGDQVNRAAALINLGVGRYQSGRAAEAIAPLEEAATIFHRLGMTEAEAAALINLGGTLRDLKRFEESIDATERAIALNRAHDGRVEGRSMFNLGIALLSVRRVDEAIDALRQAALIYQASGSGEMEADAQSNLGDGLVQAGRQAEAVVALERAAEIYADYDRGQVGAVLARLGTALMNLERFNEAISAFERAESVFRAEGDRAGLSLALNNRAAALTSVGRLDEATTASTEALAISRDTGDRRREAGASRNLGLTLAELRRPAETIKALEHAATLYRDLGDLDGERAVLHSLGTAYFSLERFDEAVTAYQRKLSIGKEDAPADQAKTLAGLAAALKFGARHDEAVTPARQAAEIYRESGSHTDEGFALGLLAEALDRLERLDEAIAVARRIVGVHRLAGDVPNEATAQRELSTMFGRAGRFAEAAPECARAAALFHKIGDLKGEDQALRNQITALYTVGERYLDEGRHEKAVEVNRQAAEVCRTNFDLPEIEASALLNLCAGLMPLGRHAEAIAAAQRAVALYRQFPERPVAYEGRALRVLGEALSQVDRLAEAVTAFKQAVDVYRAIGNPDGEVLALNELGFILMEGRRYEETLPIARRYFQVARAAGNREQEGIARMMLGAMLVDTNHLDEGISFNQESAAHFRANGDHEMEQAVLSFVQTALRKQQRSGR